MSKFFDELMEGVQQMNEIIRGGREPSREFHVDALQVQEIRKTTDLTQAKFAALIDVQLDVKSGLISLTDIHPTVDAP
ncbi:hypothetical protein [Pseudomonas sp. JL3]|uniref:hypothetical protein n=1 Tax=Pseudomonas sp. JL3 TaxID=2919943 RepID=UPI002857137F|nr:hypothetical protein [Pseudomonas sp. JL3]MDR8364765.1 hypothetical protein [Pseudomonas sp. JL3]